jgi:hypothetical protein
LDLIFQSAEKARSVLAGEFRIVGLPAGRFAQIWNARSPFYRLARREIKTHLCHSARATDANIRQALIDRFGGQEKAIGKKANPGPLHSLKGHLWSAFAVAITYWDQNNGTA